MVRVRARVQGLEAPATCEAREEPDLEEQWKKKVPNLHVHNFAFETLLASCPAVSGVEGCAHKTELQLLLGSSLLAYYCSSKEVSDLDKMLDYLRSWEYKGMIMLNKIHEDQKVRPHLSELHAKLVIITTAAPRCCR